MTDSCPFDKLGQPVFVGSIIAYGHALGRCAGLRIGRVLDLTQKARFDWLGPRDQPSPLQWQATVIGVDDDRDSRPPSLLDRTGTLFFPNRWIVLSDEQVPAAYRDLLAGFVWPRPKALTKRRRGSTI